MPFPKRFVFQDEKLIDNDFPQKARIALGYVFSDLKLKWYLVNENQVFLELNRTGRLTSRELGDIDQNQESFINQFMTKLNKLTWYQVYYFCERAYEKLLCDVEANFSYTSIEEVRNYYTKEINKIILEENLSYYMNNGVFERRSHIQTQKSLEKAGSVLSDPRLNKVKIHFNKAKKFFDARPQADLENCVKDALCALEASIEILTSKKASNDFEKSIKQLEGNKSRQIPSPIAQSMIKLHSYRGSAQGVAHAALDGNKLGPEEAELVLSLTADFITYLVSSFPFIEDVPF